MTGKIREVDYKIDIRRQKGSRSKPEAARRFKQEKAETRAWYGKPPGSSSAAATGDFCWCQGWAQTQALPQHQGAGAGIPELARSY